MELYIVPFLFGDQNGYAVQEEKEEVSGEG